MTPQEHRLMIEMFHQQDLIIKALAQALRSKGTLEEDDLLAYDALVSQSGPRRTALKLQMAAMYQEAAKACDVQTGLPEIPLN